MRIFPERLVCMETWSKFTNQLDQIRCFKWIQELNCRVFLFLFLSLPGNRQMFFLWPFLESCANLCLELSCFPKRIFFLLLPVSFLLGGEVMVMNSVSA